MIMATFLKNVRRGKKEEAAVNGGGQLSVGPPDLSGKTAREEREPNNTTEYEVQWVTLNSKLENGTITL